MFFIRTGTAVNFAIELGLSLMISTAFAASAVDAPRAPSRSLGLTPESQFAVDSERKIRAVSAVIAPGICGEKFQTAWDEGLAASAVPEMLPPDASLMIDPLPKDSKIGCEGRQGEDLRCCKKAYSVGQEAILKLIDEAKERCAKGDVTKSGIFLTDCAGAVAEGLREGQARCEDVQRIAANGNPELCTVDDILFRADEKPRLTDRSFLVPETCKVEVPQETIEFKLKDMRCFTAGYRRRLLQCVVPSSTLSKSEETRKPEVVAPSSAPQNGDLKSGKAGGP